MSPSGEPCGHALGWSAAGGSRDLGGAACIGQWDLFDSTDPADHAIARRICQSCPVRLACKALLAEARNAETEGTWAGELIYRKCREKPVRRCRMTLYAIRLPNGHLTERMPGGGVEIEEEN